MLNILILFGVIDGLIAVFTTLFLLRSLHTILIDPLRYTLGVILEFSSLCGLYTIKRIRTQTQKIPHFNETPAYRKAIILSLVVSIPLFGFFCWVAFAVFTYHGPLI